MKHATTANLPKKTLAKVADPDNLACTEDMLGEPVVRRGRGPQAAPTKVVTPIRLDADVLDHFKSQGTGYRSRINDTLRKAVNRNLRDRPRPTTRERAAA
jgi:uncharacterized protein (DUF4415 family)